MGKGLTDLVFIGLGIEPNENFRLYGYWRNFKIDSNLHIYCCAQDEWEKLSDVFILDLLRGKEKIAKIKN